MALENEATEQKERRRKRRWGDAVVKTEAAAAPAAADPNRVLALQESIRARLAAARAQQQQVTVERPVKRAKHYDLDLSVTAPTFKQEQQEPKVEAPPVKKSSNPYLAHLEEEESAAAATPQEQEAVDERLVRASKPRPRHREMHFFEAGHWQEIAQRKREKAALAAAAGYVSGRKAGHTIHSAGLADIYGRGSVEEDDDEQVVLAPRFDAHPDTRMPVSMEWWDMELLPSKLKKQVAAAESQALSKQSKAALQHLDDSQGNDDGEAKTNEAFVQESEDLRNRCLEQAALSYSKTAALVQHIIPVRPPNADTGPAKEPVLHLTKKELRRQRKLRRQEKQRELQDLQAAGLIPAPEPRLTLRNFIQVLGDQAFVDPSQMEQKVMEQIQARQRTHLERNEANKLTKEQRGAKRERKMEEDTSSGVSVAIFYVKDMSHPYHRAKVDLNAQQNKISGGVLECENPSLACVVCEGGPKAIKRFTRLMLVRMKWSGPDDALVEDVDNVEEEEEDDGEYKTQKFNPENKCELVWQGMAVKPLFKGFFFQACETSDQARKVLKAKGVANYWDQVLGRANSIGEGLQLKLTSAEHTGEEELNPYDQNDGDDIVMKS